MTSIEAKSVDIDDVGVNYNIESYRQVLEFEF